MAELRRRLHVPDSSQDTNATRDLVCSWADKAGLNPKKEKQGLLLPQRPEDAGQAGRRSADIYLPCRLRFVPNVGNIAWSSQGFGLYEV